MVEKSCACLTNLADIDRSSLECHQVREIVYYYQTHRNAGNVSILNSADQSKNKLIPQGNITSSIRIFVTQHIGPGKRKRRPLVSHCRSISFGGLDEQIDEQILPLLSISQARKDRRSKKKRNINFTLVTWLIVSIWIADDACLALRGR